MQATLPPKAALLSLFFHHTALEVSPVISGTSCSQTALALSLRDRGNRATPKHPAAPPMTSGSFAPLPKKKLLSEFSSVKKRGKKPKSCQKCFCKASVNGRRNTSCYLLTARSRTFRSVLKSLKPKSILPNYQIWDVLPVYILNGKLIKRKEWNTSKLLIAYKPTIFGKFWEIFDWLLYNESHTQAPHQGITDADDQSVWFSLIAYVFKLFDFRSNEITRHFHFTLNVCVINS